MTLFLERTFSLNQLDFHFYQILSFFSGQMSRLKEGLLEPRTSGGWILHRQVTWDPSLELYKHPTWSQNQLNFS